MSIEHEVLSRRRTEMLSKKTQAIVTQEIAKGCEPTIAREPVALEPRFRPVTSLMDAWGEEDQNTAVPERAPLLEELVRLPIWIPPDLDLDWRRAEFFNKQLHSVSHRVGFEVVGDQRKISMTLLFHEHDHPVVSAAFEGAFEQCALSVHDKGMMFELSTSAWEQIMFCDYFPPPPYSHLLTQPGEIKLSPYESLMTAMAKIPVPGVGVWQVLFQPVPAEHDWHRNVQFLLDLEYSIKLWSGLQQPQRYLNQAPSGDLRQMAWEVENKAHSDKPFCAMACRLAVVGVDPPAHRILRSLSAFASLFQHGGRPLDWVTNVEYEALLEAEQVRDLFLRGLTYRPGFLVNSWELTGPVHLPPASLVETKRIPIETLETLPLKEDSLRTGTPIGTSRHAGDEQLVCIPEVMRPRSLHVVGRPSMGKSILFEHMILDDVRKGAGVAVIDPHGDLVERLLCLMPEDHVKRTIYLNPGDLRYVPIWNPFGRIPGQDAARMADEMVGAIKSVVSGWGDRLEHFLRHTFFALGQLPNSSLLDAAILLKPKSEESKCIRKAILEVMDNETGRQFWQEDFGRYRSDDLTPPQHKLSKLVVGGTVSLMLSQSESLFDLRQIMDDGMILLVNLSTIGTEVREILGSFMLALLHLTAMSRSDTAIGDRRPFHVYCDEAHRFLTEALDDLIAETRKFNVGLALAHQYMEQFGHRKVGALSNVGTTIIFNVDARDARYLAKDLRDLAQVEDLVALEQGEAIARIGTEVVRIRTMPPNKIPELNFREEIIAHSRQKYYRPVAEVREEVRRRGDRWLKPFTPLTPVASAAGEIEELTYDEFPS